MLVARIHAQLTPEQFDNRCYSNKVHFVLSDKDRRDEFLKSASVVTLLAKTPKFIPTPRSLSAQDIVSACDRFGYNLVRTFDRAVRKQEIEAAQAEAGSAGIRNWMPKPYPKPPSFYGEYTRDYFRCQNPDRDVWRREWMRCPVLPRFIASAKTEAANLVAHVGVSRSRGSGNLTYLERQALMGLRRRQLGYNISDKNFGPVLYSRSEFLAQCKLHLFDEKGTYEPVSQTKAEVLSGILSELRELLRPVRGMGPSWRNVADSMLQWALASVRRARLCRFYVIWKLHKAAAASGLRTRPIAPNIGYVTGQLSHFLHCQLKDAVWAHPYVLRDSLDLIRVLENFKLYGEWPVKLLTADVAALYPSIDLQEGLKALRWFVDNFGDYMLPLRDVIVRFADFVLRNNYVECEGIGEPSVFRQMIGTAMGTSFSVVYAIIFMLWLETPVIEEFSHWIKLYKRFIDDLFVVWMGPVVELDRFRHRMGNADRAIKLDWQCLSTDVSIRDSRGGNYALPRAVFLDLDIRVINDSDGLGFELRTYRKPGNAYAYLPHGSYHAPHTERAWIKAELLRLLTHCSSPSLWSQDAAFFYSHLRSRGYPKDNLDAIFAEVRWSQRDSILSRRPSRDAKAETFFQVYRGCVFSVEHRPGTATFRRLWNLRLDSLRADSAEDIFPTRAFWTLRSAPRLGTLLPR